MEVTLASEFWRTFCNILSILLGPHNSNVESESLSISSFSLHFLAAWLPDCHTLCNPTVKRQRQHDCHGWVLVSSHKDVILTRTLGVFLDNIELRSQELLMTVALELYVEGGVDNCSVTAWQQPGSYIKVFSRPFWTSNQYNLRHLIEMCSF